MMRSVIMLALLLSLTACMVKCAWGAEVRLEWNPNPEPDIAGYELEVTGDAVKSILAIGTSASVDLSPGTYQFAVRAVNTAGLESPLSDAISHTVPADSWPRVTAASEAPQFPASNLIDGKPLPIFASRYDVPQTDPQWVEIDQGEVRWIGGIRYLPRQDAYTPGHLTNYQVLLDGSMVAQGAFETLDKAEKAILFRPTLARRVRVLSTLTHLTGSELTLIEREPPMVRVTLQESSDMTEWRDIRTDQFPMTDREFFRLKIETP